MSNVLGVKESTWKKDGQDVTSWWVTLDDRTDDVPCYDEQAKTLKEHEPLPDGWEVKTSKAGKDYLAPPRAARGGGGGGFAAAFRNTKEGQAVEQDMMNRRTALMQAVTLWTNEHGEETLIDVAQLLYVWLTDTRYVSGAAVATVSDNGGVKASEPRLEAQASPSTLAGESSGSDGSLPERRGSAGNSSGAPEPGLPPATPSGGESEVFGEGAKDSPSAVHIHEWTPAPREGWALCICGLAEKASKVVMPDA
jgi:hypothetical protein